MFVLWSTELHKEVELKRFVAQLKKELLSADRPTSEEEGSSPLSMKYLYACI